MLHRSRIAVAISPLDSSASGLPRPSAPCRPPGGPGRRPVVRPVEADPLDHSAAHRRGEHLRAVTLVARNGRVAHLESHGHQDIAAKKPMPTNAVFRIMSMTKPIVGAAILMMMEEGKLRLADPVSRFIPEYKGLKVAVETPRAAGPGGAARDESPSFYTVPATREITIRDLLTHTSGLVSGGVSASEAAKIDRTRTDTIGTYLPKLATVPLAFQPGAMGVQPRRRLRRARPHRRGRVGSAPRPVPEGADVRAARHEGHLFRRRRGA